MRTVFKPILLARMAKMEQPKDMMPKVRALAPLTRYGSCWPPAPVSVGECMVSWLVHPRCLLLVVSRRRTVEGGPDTRLGEGDHADEDDVEQRAAVPAREARHGLRGLGILDLVVALVGLLRDVGRHCGDIDCVFRPEAAVAFMRGAGEREEG